MGSVSMGNGDIIGILDLTLLDRGASEEDLVRLCERASPIALLLSASFLSTLDCQGPPPRRGESGLRGGGFPVGWRDPTKVSKAISEAIDFGADEIDCVLEPTPNGGDASEEDLQILSAMREAMAKNPEGDHRDSTYG